MKLQRITTILAVLVALGVAYAPQGAKGWTDPNWATSNGDWFVAGNWNTGIIPLNISGQNFHIGNGGTANITSGTATVYNGDVGGSGHTGFLNINGGELTCTSAGGITFIGNLPGSYGSVTVTNGTWTNACSVYVGGYGTGILLINGGSVSIGDSAMVGFAGGTGVATVTSGSLVISNDMWIGQTGSGSPPVVGNGNGTLNLSGTGIVNVGGTIWLAGDAGSIGTINIGTGGATVGTLIAGEINGGDGTATVNFNYTGAQTYNNNFTGTVSITKAGAGTLNLTGTNTYSGGTTLNAGTLQASGSALGTGAVTLNGGTLAPTGNLNISALKWNGGSISLSLGTSTYVVNSSGSLTLGGGGTFAFTAGAGFAGNTSYEVLTAANLNDSMIGLFSANTLSISGTATNAIFSRTGSGLYVDYATSSSTYTASGSTTISGSGTTTVGGVNFTGGSTTTIASGSLLSVASGSIAMGAGTSYANGSTISSPGDMAVTGGGTLRGTSNLTAGGNITVGSGAVLAMDGTLTPQGGTLGVLSGGTLGGNTIVAGNMNNAGTLSPGHSPGTVTVNGNFVQQSGGTFQLQVQSSTIFDRLFVTGSATLAGTLQVQSWAGHQFAFGEAVPFIQAGSITGTFSSIQMENPSTFRGRFLVDGGTGTLLVAPASYVLVAQTTNQRNVAKALDHYITAVGNDREVVSSALDKMSENQYPAAFNAISPAFHETIANITLEQAFDQTQMLNQRLSSVRLGAQGFQLIGMNAEPLAYDKNGKRSADPKDLKTVIQQDSNPNWSAWAMGSGIFGRMTDVSQIPNYHSETGSCLVGADYRWSPNFSTGLYGGYQGTYVDYANKSNTRMNSALFGGYATYSAGGFYTDAVVGGGYNAYNVRRTIDFSTINRTAQSDQQSGQLNAALNFGYDWKVSGFTLGPVLGAQYTYVGIAPFTETGASSLDLAVKQQNANSLRTTLGGRIAYTWNVSSKIVLIPEIRMLWEQEFMNGSRAIGSSLAGGSGPSFSTWTDAPERSSAFAGAGVSTQIGSTWNASVFYNVDFGRQNYLANMVSASLGLKF